MYKISMVCFDKSLERNELRSEIPCTRGRSGFLGKIMKREDNNSRVREDDMKFILPFHITNMIDHEIRPVLMKHCLCFSNNRSSLWSKYFLIVQKGIFRNIFIDIDNSRHSRICFHHSWNQNTIFCHSPFFRSKRRNRNTKNYRICG